MRKINRPDPISKSLQTFVYCVLQSQIFELVPLDFCVLTDLKSFTLQIVS